MSDKMDAVIIAGTHKSPKRLIHGRNKAFLDFHGQPMILHVVKKFVACPDVGRIVVVGPRERLEETMGELLETEPRLKLIPQRSRVLENVWTGFLGTFEDGNNLPYNREFETLLLGGQLPIRKKMHLEMFYAVYAAVAAQMNRESTRILPRSTVIAAMEQRFDAFRLRHSRREWFMGRVGVDTILESGNILRHAENGIEFARAALYEFFLEWDRRFNKQILVATCDIPLITPDAVTDLITRSREFNSDFLFSISTAEILERFHSGRDSAPGIKRPFLQLRETKFRAANMIIVRPNCVGNKQIIQEGFGIRKITEWKNVFSMIGKLVAQKNRYQTLKMALLTQTIAVLDRNGFKSMSEWIRRRTRGKQLEMCISSLFRAQFNFIVTRYGSVSLDVDTEEDYKILIEQAEYFKEIQREIIREPITHDIQVFRS